MNLKELLKHSNEKAEEYIEYVQNEEFNARLDNGEIEVDIVVELSGM